MTLNLLNLGNLKSNLPLSMTGLAFWIQLGLGGRTLQAFPTLYEMPSSLQSLYTLPRVFCKEKNKIIENIINVLWQSWFITRRLTAAFIAGVPLSGCILLVWALRTLAQCEVRKARRMSGGSRLSLLNPPPRQLELFQAWVQPSNSILERSAPPAPETVSGAPQSLGEPMVALLRIRGPPAGAGAAVWEGVSLKVRDDGS